MRIEKLTTKFQEALAQGQSLAVQADNQFIEPEHVLQAFLQDQDNGIRSLLTRSGVNLGALGTAVDTLAKKIPQVVAHGDVQVGRNLLSWLNLAEKEASKKGDEFIAVELFFLV